MNIAITGATGFLGRYLVDGLTQSGHNCRCWYRPESDRDGFLNTSQIEWIRGELGDAESGRELVTGCDAVVHAALHHDRRGQGLRGGEGDVMPFIERNVMGTLSLIEAARNAQAERFVFISTCAVHEKILDDRPLDEAHPLWASSHYGAHKAAIEQFVHSYGFGQGYPICALRPTGIYGIAKPLANSKWYDLVRSIVHGRDVECVRGGKEVHAADVTRAVEILLTASGIAGESYSCYDRYVSAYDVAQIAKRLTNSTSEILGKQTRPKHQIVNEKIKRLGMEFGGTVRLEETIESMIGQIRA